MFSSPELEATVRRAIALYNRFRSPEAVAWLISVTPVSVTIGFLGSFCYSCGVLNYIEEFMRQVKVLTDTLELKIGKTRQISQNSFEVDYKVVQKP